MIAENVSNSEWIEKVKPAIINRINLYANNEIKFNLLALVPNRMANLAEHEKDLQKRVDYLNGLLGKSPVKQESQDVNVKLL